VTASSVSLGRVITYSVYTRGDYLDSQMISSLYIHCRVLVNWACSRSFLWQDFLCMCYLELRSIYVYLLSRLNVNGLTDCLQVFGVVERQTRG